jgi:uncharacterized coiled-coil protein SlyX
MTDLASIAQALSSVKQATDIVKALRNADTAYERAELKLKIAELAEALAEARLGILEAQGEIEDLKQRLAQAEKKNQTEPIKRAGVYFFKAGDTEVGPCCPRCFEADGKRMPLTAFTAAFRAIGKYNCPQCKATY